MGVNVLRFIAALTFVCALLVACGGGGSSGGGDNVPPTIDPTSTPTPATTHTPSSSVTNAFGVVVDDANGAPLAGVGVKLMPWAPCGPTPPPLTITPESDGCPTPLPSPQTTSAADGSFMLNGAPNGHYILVVGNDAVSTPPPGYAPPTCTTACGTPSPAPFTIAATVHDNVTLIGGAQKLMAPVLPAVPSGYVAPAWETNGDYRLATLNEQTEMPCYIAWQYERAQHGLAGASVDEWLTENVRANLGYLVANDGGTISFLTTGNAGDSGGADCLDSLVAVPFGSGNVYAIDSRTLWMAGAYYYYGFAGVSNESAFGLAQFDIDPRGTGAFLQLSWP